MIKTYPSIAVQQDADRLERELKAQALQNISTTLEKGSKLAQSLSEGSTIKQFVEDLVSYLNRKKDSIGSSFWYDHHFKVNRRAAFIDKCLNAIAERNIDVLRRLLEEKIKNKKPRSQLYNLLPPCQALFDRHKSRQDIMIQNSPLPPPILEIVNQYDDNFFSDTYDCPKEPPPKKKWGLHR